MFFKQRLQTFIDLLNINKIIKVSKRLQQLPIIIIDRDSEMNSLPIGFAQHVLTLQIQLQQQEESLQLLQMLGKMYRIAVDYYLQVDDMKVMYFQKKFNSVMVKCLQAYGRPQKKVNLLPCKIKKEMNHFQQCQETVIKSFVENTEKAQQRFQKRLQADISKQQQILKNKMLRRVKSSGKIPLYPTDCNI